METEPSISENCDVEVPNECNSEIEDNLSDEESTTEQEYTRDFDCDDEENEDSVK